MTNLTPIGNEADILRESKIPSQTSSGSTPNAVPPVLPPQDTVNSNAPELTQAPSAMSGFSGEAMNMAPDSDYSDLGPKAELVTSTPDSNVKPYSEPVSFTPKAHLPQPIKETSYKPFSYKLPVMNYVLSFIFFIISTVALVYYVQLFFGGLQDLPAADEIISGVQIVGFSVNLGSSDFGAIAGHFAIASTLLLALTLLLTTRFILYLSVFASLFGTAYWGYALSFSISKISIDAVFSGLGIYILLFYIFMFSMTLTAFIHTVKSSIRT